MSSRWHRFVLALRGAADALVGALLAALFTIFVLQIAFRYLLNWPLGWTVELCLTMWLWLVLLGAALSVPEREHVRFDLLVQKLPRRARRLAGIAVALALFSGFAAVIEPSWEYVSFYRIKRSATLRIPLSYVFAVSLVFAIAMAARQLWVLWRLVKKGDVPREPSEERFSAAAK